MRAKILICFVVFFSAVAIAFPLYAQTINSATITIDPSKKYQTITGWEATAQAGQIDSPVFDTYKDTLFDQAVNDLGINRLRVEVMSGAENPVDYFTQYRQGRISFDEWRKHWSEIINDNNDPQVINSAGFQFSLLDNAIETVALPLKQRLAARGEKLFININYVDFGSSAFEHKNNPAEYAEFVWATVEHLQNKYRITPDSWEVILEPDTGAAWSAAQIGQAIAAAGNFLTSKGTAVRFVAPSTTSMGNASVYFDTMLQTPGVLPYLSELSYHRYRGVSTANLQAIATRAKQNNINTAMLEHIGSSYGDLHEDLKIGQNSAWQQFTLAYPTGDDGAQYYTIDQSDPAHPKVVMGSRTKFLRQYFKFIRSGAVRIEATSIKAGLDPVAFINSNGGYVVVVKAGGGDNFSIQGLPPARYGIKYTTTSQYDVDATDITVAAGQALTTSIPTAGVITIYAKSAATATNITPLPTLRLTTVPTATAAACPLKSQGDCTCDNLITLADYTCWQKSYLKSQPIVLGDFDNNGQCTLSDFETLRVNLATP